MAIAALARIEETNLTLDLVKKLFSDHATQEELEFHWNGLIQAGVLHVDKRGVAHRSSDLLSTPNDVRKDGVHGYYRQVSELASRAVDVDVHRREFQCFAVPLNTNRMQELKQLIRDFREKIAEAAAPGGREVYQVNLQMFPLTNAVI